MSSLYPQYYQNSSNQEQYVNELFAKRDKLEKTRRLNNAIHNPLTGFIHLEDPNARPASEYSADVKIPWGAYPKVINTKRYQELRARQASGQRHANDDQVEYNFYTDEFVDEALRAHSAGVITSQYKTNYSETSYSLQRNTTYYKSLRQGT
jgi:hypothetical protein